MIGRTFGSWKVLHFGLIKNKSKYYKCICNCGTTTLVRGQSLVSGKSKSCGCQQRQNFKKSILKERLTDRNGKKLTRFWSKNRRKVILRSTYLSTIKRSKKHKNTKILTFEQWCDIVSKPCTYCGVKYSKVAKDKSSDVRVRLNGVDRINSSVGYTLKNSTSCCAVCNMMKSNLRLCDFTKHIFRIVKHRKK